MRIDSTVVGMACFYNNDINTLNGYISLIGIKSEFQGRGLGRTLMNYIVLECKKNGMKSLKLEVDNDNISAIAFYEKYGFAFSGEARSESRYMTLSL